MRGKVPREEWLKDTNNEESAGDFNRQRKKAQNIIRCEKESIYRIL